MNRNSLSQQFHLSISSIPSLKVFTVCITLLICLSSYEAGSNEEYKFQPESLHWLQFRGPNASGIAPENADPPVHFSADTNLLWKTEILPGWSSPCIVDEKIFLTGFNDADSLLYTMAIHRKNGEIIWKDSISPAGYYDLHPVNGYANPTVASDGERIFAYFPNYGLIAYDLNGTRSWDFHIEKVGETRWAGSCSPVVLDSLILMDVSAYNDPRILALDCRTGNSQWVIRDRKHRRGSIMSRATPVVWNDLVILHHFYEIIAYNLLTGKAEWWLPIPTSAVGTTVIQDNILFVNTWTGEGEKSLRGNQATFEELVRELDINGNMKIERNEFTDDIKVRQRPESPDAPQSSRAVNNESFFAGFDEDGDGAFVESEWNAMWEKLQSNLEEHGMLAVSLKGTGKRPVTDIKWKVNEDTPETPSPLIVNENVLFIKSGGIMTVINQKTGEVVHKDRVGAAGAYLSSPMLAGNRIYTCSYNGTVTVLSADDYSVLARNKLKGKIGASPVAVDDVLYVRTDKHLYAFREQ
jgi:outer membrane protein assembly factor BamB